ncbi:hypothetical protein [Ideonella sp. A 288]|uniref:hypothetical protein n=1 Tax=Ideonella sp. A 288 TaxID=1962181 RepID=UPI000B4B11F1|nr:hypothetical protein [Ideonella sp. A 288]
MAYYASVVLENKASATERHEDLDTARRWIEEERRSKPKLFQFGQIIEATPARPVVASCNANGWNPT